MDLARPALIVGAVNLAESIRRYGHLAARLDPLGGTPIGDPSLEPSTHGLTDADLRSLPPDLVIRPPSSGAASLSDVIERLREIYCSTTGYDFAHIFVPEERRWLRAAVETGRFRAAADPIDPVALLDRLTEVESFERFLQRAFPGKTRFSIEGLDMLVPILDEVIAEAAEAGVRQVFIGMAHRGRLNVMAHVLKKPYEQVLAEFRDPLAEPIAIDGMTWSGDVTYHRGASRNVAGGDAASVIVTMPPNPSHLEAINPVLEGMARAAGTDASRPGEPTFDRHAVLPILVHGDAAFPGQGVVAETLNLHRLAGYTTGGTIHVIANNQIGFTTEPAEAYSTHYASSLARAFKIPIVHVNADDPEACVAAARLAFAYRAAFGRDVLIDLIGYRRYGHSEPDEPSFTQPTMYRAIATHPSVRELWAKSLEERGAVEPGRATSMLERRIKELQGVLDRISVSPEQHLVEPLPAIAPAGTAAQVASGVPLDRLRQLNAELLAVPKDFAVHRKLGRARERRRSCLDNPGAHTVDWAAAEDLALASILADGTAVRLTGQDSERGTFSQRHAAFVDANDGRRFVPLQHFAQARAAFEIRNSPLSENAAVGFEYGYNIQSRSHLVLWEAQYGDFVNGAQVMLDEFVLSARAKWGQEPSLVLLLPHGYEGHGPDHVSGRPERFLQLAADVNVRIANCTTAAQYFHLLRRQAALLVDDPLPLVVFTPKSLLRDPRVLSAPRDLAEGSWMPIIEESDDDPTSSDRAQVRRLLLCSGKVGVDLMKHASKARPVAVAICRVEQLFPIPVREITSVLERYPRLEELCWVQEEPQNMGAWGFMRPSLESVAGTARLSVVSRPPSSSPAEGSAARHAEMQGRIITQAFAMTDGRG